MSQETQVGRHPTLFAALVSSVYKGDGFRNWKTIEPSKEALFICKFYNQQE